MVVHRDSPIGETYEHFYTVESVHRLVEKLVNKINELEVDKLLKGGSK